MLKFVVLTNFLVHYFTHFTIVPEYYRDPIKMVYFSEVKDEPIKLHIQSTSKATYPFINSFNFCHLLNAYKIIQGIKMAFPNLTFAVSKYFTL